jgi:hypothetical protein
MDAVKYKRHFPKNTQNSCMSFAKMRLAAQISFIFSLRGRAMRVFRAGKTDGNEWFEKPFDE